MVDALPVITLDEFVEGMLEGRTDFSRVRLSRQEGRGLAAHPRYEELQAHLLNNQTPVNVSGSELPGLVAPGLYLHNAVGYLHTAVGTGVKLTDADLRGANFGGADLRRADFDGANLRGANFEGANLWRANLGGANLRGANLMGANLERAYLGGAYLGGADLGRAYLWGADFRGANLGEADFGGADLREANLVVAQNLEMVSNLAYAIFGGTKVTPSQQKIIEAALASRGPLFKVIQ